jgi:hypothetical protein
MVELRSPIAWKDGRLHASHVIRAPPPMAAPPAIRVPRGIRVPGPMRVPHAVRPPGALRGPRDAPLGALIAAAHARHGRRALDRDIFGTDDPGEIAAMVDRFCVRSLGAAIERYEFFATSVHSVHGLRLSDRRRVVVKVARQSSGAASFFNAVQSVQSHLVASGFPCPRPLLEASLLHGGIAVVEELVDRGSRANGHRPRIRRAMAAGLAEQIRLCRGFVDIGGLGPPMIAMAAPDQAPPSGAHDHIFDPSTHGRGAEWIDELAGAARDRLAANAGDELVVAHTDWRSEHVRFKRAKVIATYDWESLAIGSEPAILGHIAHTFTIDFGIEQKRRMPTLHDFRAFVADYERARGRRFTAAQQSTIDAAWVYAIAYNARCQHLDAAPTINPHKAYGHEDSFRGMLARYGEQLVA